MPTRSRGHGTHRLQLRESNNQRAVPHIELCGREIGPANGLGDSRGNVATLNRIEGRRWNEPSGDVVREINSLRLGLHEAANRMLTRRRRLAIPVVARLPFILTAMRIARVLRMMSRRAVQHGHAMLTKMVNAASQQSVDGEHQANQKSRDVLHRRWFAAVRDQRLIKLYSSILRCISSLVNSSFCTLTPPAAPAP